MNVAAALGVHPFQRSNEQVLKPELYPPIQGYADALREGAKASAESQRHLDTMVTWAIGLAGGAIISVLNLFPRFRECFEVYDIVLACAPWIITISLGIGTRVSLFELMDADRLYSFAKIHALEALRFMDLEPPTLLKQVTDIMNEVGEEKQLGKLKKKMSSRQRITSFLYYATCSLFGLSTIWLIFFYSARLGQCQRKNVYGSHRNQYC